MPYFSNRSKDRLASCHVDLQTIFNEVIKYWDCAIVEGHRSEERQNKLFEAGKTQLRFPASKHNELPSVAVDVVPYFKGAVFGSGLKEKLDMAFFAGFVISIAQNLLATGKISHQLRWGGDWNNNHSVQDTNFLDMPHFELREVGNV